MLTVKATWEKVACGVIPIVVAAATTNMAYEAARALETDLEEYQIYDPDQFGTKYTTYLRALNLSGSSFDASKVRQGLTPVREQKGPELAWLALIKFKSFYETASDLDLKMVDSYNYCPAGWLSPIPYDDPMQFLAKTSSCTEQEDDQIDMDRRYLQQTLERMGRLLIREMPEPFLLSTPLIQDFKHFLGPKEGKRTQYPMTLSFGLEMLVQGTKSYVQAFAGESLFPCRIRSLQFALEYYKSIT